MQEEGDGEPVGDEVEIEEDFGEENQDMQMDDEPQNDSSGAFAGHTDSVYSVAFHPVLGDIAATGGGDDRAFIWRISTGEPLFELTGHTDSIIQVAFSANGKYLATGGMDGYVKIWEAETGKIAANLEGPNEVIWIQWHPRGNIILAGAQDGSAWMWAANGQVMQVFSGHTGAVTCGGFTPDGKVVVTGSEDFTVIVWDPKTGTPIHKFLPTDARFNQAPITAIGFNHESTVIATGSDDHHSKLLHIQSGKILASFESHTEGIESISFSPVLPLVATGGIDGKICIWDTQTLRQRHTLSHDDAVVKVHWHEKEALLYSCSMDRTVRVWDVRSGACVRVFRGHFDPILDIAVSSDGKTILSTSDDQRSLIFKL